MYKLWNDPFSILARHGFIAKTLLLSLEKIGIQDQTLAIYLNQLKLSQVIWFPI